MLESILKALSSLFGALFGGNKTTPTSGGNKPTTPTPTPNPNPSTIDTDPEEEEIAQDASEVTPDSIVVVTNEIDLEIIEEVENENAPQTETETEEDVFDEVVEDVDEVLDPESETTDDNSTIDTTGGDTTEEDPVTIGGESPDDTIEDETPPEDENLHEQRFLWCLDNGHGKLTSGKRSPVFDDGKTQFFEYEFNRDIVKRIIEKLDVLGIAYFNVVPQVDVGNILEERVNRANAKQSNLTKIYLSIHSNAAPAPSSKSWASPNINGIETWHYHGSSKGQRIAAVFQKHLLAQTGWKNRHLKSRAQGQFYVLRKTRMTAILTENGFYNNKKQATELMKDSIRQKIADAHIAAILEIEQKGITGLLG